MNNYIKQPMLSTDFSESGKSAKKRFDNILNTKVRKTGVSALVLIVIFMGIIGTMVACQKNVSQTRTQSWRNNGTAIITKDIDLFSDSQGTNKITTLKKNDLVYVIYDQNDEFYYVQPAVMDIPSTQGYVPKNVVSFDINLFNNANYGIVKSGKIYKSPEENDVYEKSDKYVFHITKRQGEWAEVNLRGGDDGKWVKTADISYELIPFMIDLSHTNLQRDVDNGHQPWRLDPLEVARDYVFNTLNKDGGEFKVFHDDSATGSISYLYIKFGEKELQVVVYQPMKKDNSGIWVVNKGTLIRNQIENVLPPNRQVKENSGMVWRINVKKDENLDFDLINLAEKLGINAPDYYDKDLDVSIYTVETAKYSSQQYTSPPYILVYDNTELIAYKDLQTPENEQRARDILISLDKYRGVNE